MVEEQQRSLIDIYNERAKSLKEKYYFIIERDPKEYYKMLRNYEYFKDIMRESDFKGVIRDKSNRSKRRSRANKKVRAVRLLDRPRLVFGTCTFNDEQFYKKNGKEIKERTRTKKVNEWLMRHFEYSVVNIDYGEINEREHHHFIGVIKKDHGELTACMNKNGKQAKSKKGRLLWNLDKEHQDYDLGFECQLEKIEYDPEDYNMKKVSNYLLKIKNHINKESTHNRRFRVLGEIKV